ncbi:MAG: prepilin-type N-terminal cleavage/methylation domain-containing protein [Desulfobacterales bacterium]
MTEDRPQRTDFLDCGLRRTQSFRFRIVWISPRTSQHATRNQPRIHHRVSSNQHRATGFTLLEVMVAMAIMAIVLVSVYRMHSQTLAMNSANRFYTQAPMLAQSKLAQLETGSSEIIASDAGDFGDKFPGYSWNVAVEEVAVEALGEAANDFKKIDLTVSFNNNEYIYNVRTYRFMRD